MQVDFSCPCGQAGKRVLDDPLKGFFCEACGRFDEAFFLDNWHPIYFMVFSFIHRFMRKNLETTGTDYLMNKIASEIWIYNMGQVLTGDNYISAVGLLQNDAGRQGVLKKCNTYSIAQYLGISQETARRKVAALVEKGWVVKNPDGSLIISAACEAEFKPEFNLETMRDFLSTARGVFSLLTPRA